MKIITTIGVSMFVIWGIAYAAFFATYKLPEIRADIYETWPELFQEERNPVDLIRAELGMKGDYVFDALALNYLDEFTDDEDEIQSIASYYWCGTPTLQYFADGGVEPPKTELRTRAALLLMRHRLEAEKASDDS
jgi:hypothetical protein